MKNITRKKVFKIFKRRVLADRERWCDLILNTYPLDFFVFVDETAKNRVTDHRTMARAVLGKRAYVQGHFDRGVRHAWYWENSVYLLCCVPLSR